MNCLKSPCEQEITPFRYVEINGNCTVTDVQRHTAFPETFSDDDSFFESDNENLNRIWEFPKYSMKATAAFGIFVDGERERLPYEGDTYINQLGWFACCADPEIPRKTIDYFEEHPTWPTEWQLLTPILARDYLLYTGDHSSVKRWLQWLPERLLPSLQGSDGLVRGNHEIRDIVDWPLSERDDYEFGTVYHIDFFPKTSVEKLRIGVIVIHRSGGFLYQIRGGDIFQKKSEVYNGFESEKGECQNRGRIGQKDPCDQRNERRSPDQQCK